MSTIDPHEDAVRLKAYALWEASGRTHGHDRSDWLQAEAVVAPMSVTSLELDPDTMTGAASDPTFIDAIKEEIHELAHAAGKAVHYVEELLGIVPPAGKASK